jgi:hypothetical protein
LPSEDGLSVDVLLFYPIINVFFKGGLWGEYIIDNYLEW